MPTGSGTPPADDAVPSPARTSDLLAELAGHQGGDASAAEIVAALRNRSFGLLLVIFGAPCMLPLPPPFPLICATMMIVVACNLLAGRNTMWLPDFLRRRRMPRSTLSGAIRRIMPLTVRLERLCRPRLLWATERTGKAMIGAVVLVMAAVLLLPIPVVGNFTPGLAVAVTGLGLSERDGLVIGLGFVAAGAAVVVTGIAGWAAVAALAWLIP